MRVRKNQIRAVLTGILLPALLCGCAENTAKDEVPSKEESSAVWESVPEVTEVSTEAAAEAPTAESTEPAETASTEETESEKEEEGNGYLVAIDPGHQAPDVDMSAQEPVGPGASTTKAKATSGTQGTYTGIGEYALNLDISLLLRDQLEEEGYDVLLTREDNETAISNAERAQKALDAGADLYVRIHANGSTDPSASGALALVASAENPYVGSMHDTNRELAEDILNQYCESTGMANDGIVDRDDLTGLNWAGTMPAMLLELGYMTNRTDDLNMADPTYRAKMVAGIAAGIDQYAQDHPKESSDVAADTETAKTGSSNETAASASSALSDLLAGTISSKDANGGNEISVYAGLADGSEEASWNDATRQAASLIKLYIAGAVYENRTAVTSQESWQGETDSLLKQMITVSDNDAANTLTTRLGNGSAASGMAVVNQYCSAHGYTHTSMGRLLLAPKTNGDNLTSAGDCAAFLRDVYQGRLTGSADILSLLKQQQRRSKIPAGVPSGVTVANKTGELTDVENDAAIVFTSQGDYILTVLSEDLPDAAAERSLIVSLSQAVYQYFTS
ncbi:MAG: N-acetylmuramoyl-L-alanine amidase [Lachnospiraceae bacterium]